MDDSRPLSTLVASAGLTLFLLSGCSSNKGRITEVTQTFDSVKCRSSAAIESEFIVQWKDGRFSVEKGDTPEDFRENFVSEHIEEIRHVQINQRIRLELPQSQGLLSQAFTNSAAWGQERIEASTLWSQGYKGQGIKVAVIDSVIDVSHSQLRSRIARNTSEIPNNGADDDGNGVIDDVWGAAFLSQSNSTRVNDHGTHVSGVIAADPTQGPMSGVAPEAEIIAASFLDGDGSGTLGDAILALQYAAARGARIINASWGGSGCSDALGNAFAALSAKGILIVVAAGNSGADIDLTPFYPALFNLPTQLTVSASDFDDIVPAWSNTGFQNAHLTAPGVDIESLAFNNRYVTMDGTSMASPFVAGAAAALWSARPQATAQQVRLAILRGVDVIPGKNSKTLTRGRLNLKKSLDELRRLTP
jgi:subtilisin family serine protease